MTRMAPVTRLCAAVLIMAGTANAFGGSKKPEELAFEALARTLADQLKTNPNAMTLQAQAQLYPLALGFLGAPHLNLADVEDARLDKQVGTSSDGGTSAVTKGVAPAVLGLAVEAGGLERSQEGTVVTFRGNPVGLLGALAGVDPFASRTSASGATRFLRRISFALNFDTEGDHNAEKSSQFKGGSVRVELLNRRDPQDRVYGALWRGFSAGAAQQLANDLAAAFFLMFQDSAVKAWSAENQRLLPLQQTETLPTFVAVRLKALHEAPVETATREAAERAARTFADTYLLSRQQVLDAVNRGPLITLEYTNERRADLPTLSTVNLIGETSIWGGQGDLTGNVSVTLFDSVPIAAPDRVRDLKLGAQLDFRLGDIDRARAFVLSVSGRYERLRANQGATPAPDTLTGNIWLGQLKLSVPTKGRGVQIPVSVTVSNRTELIKEHDVRGQIGVTLDLDAIIAAR